MNHTLKLIIIFKFDFEIYVDNFVLSASKIRCYEKDYLAAEDCRTEHNLALK